MPRTFYGAFTVGVAAVIACSSSTSNDDGTEPGDDAGPGASGDDAGKPTSTDSGSSADADAAVTPLACDAHTWCTTYDVKIFRGTVPAPAGGTVADGTYRLAYSLEPADVDPDGTTDYSALVIIAGSSYLGIDDTGAGFTGTYSTSSSNLTTEGVTTCNAFGAQGSAASGMPFTEPYTATPTTLTLFETLTPLGPDAGAPWTKALVYTRVTGSLCDQATEDPAAPSDSYYCRVANCSCAEATDKTLAAGDCPFIH